MNLSRNRAGRGAIGCVTSIVVLVIVAYLVVKFLPPWMHFEQYNDVMRSDARYAVTLPDSVIRAGLIAQADTLGLPSAARHIVITRGGVPPTIRISADYTEEVVLPFLGVKRLHFKPAAEEGL